MGEASNQLLREHKHHLKKLLAFQSPCMPSQPQRERAGRVGCARQKKTVQWERKEGSTAAAGGRVGLHSLYLPFIIIVLIVLVLGFCAYIGIFLYRLYVYYMHINIFNCHLHGVSFSQLAKINRVQ
jgi:hypothetical protein